MKAGDELVHYVGLASDGRVVLEVGKRTVAVERHTVFVRAEAKP